ncbi:MAG: type II toxin-antitoxin system RelE/ParE family toxin [Bacteroidetes bacterium]|nr:type II toxin-antitoxin system RelE/ParE family toxin [Bacteroidota bacterium]
MKIITSPNFEKQLDKLSDIEAKKIYKKLNELSTHSENLKIKKLKTRNDYRLRIGDYRVIFEYTIIENEIFILLQNVFHRKDAYKKRK